MARKHSSQFKYDGEDADTLPLRIWPKDKANLRKLNPELYTYLPASFWHALTEPDANYFRWAKRAARMARYRTVNGETEEPLLHRRQYWFRHAIYSRAKRGDEIAGEPYPYRGADGFAHRFNGDMAMASLEIGVNEAKDFELVRWPDLRDRGWTERGKPKFIPDATLALEVDLRTPREATEPRPVNPHTFFLPPLRKPRFPKDEPPPHRYRGDATPSLLRHNTHGQLFILTREDDRDTEAFTGATDRATIMQKYRDIKHIFDNDLYVEKYGFPNSIVLIVTVSERRMHALLEHSKAVFGERCPYIWHTWSDDWGTEQNPPPIPPPSGTMFTRPWKRLGYPDAYLKKFWLA